MAYRLSAVIGSLASLEVLEPSAPWSFVRLTTSLYLAPYVQEVYDALPKDEPSGSFVFHDLQPALLRLLESASYEGPLAYVEAEYLGGEGTQAALVLDEGRFLLEPSEEPNAINLALRELGVRSRGALDEFDSVGLGRYRDTAEWLDDL